MLMRAVEAASDALFRREGGADAGSNQGGAAAQTGVCGAGTGRRECGAGAGTRDGHDGDARADPKQRRADAVGLLAERALAAGFCGDELDDGSQPQSPDEGQFHGEPRNRTRKGPATQPRVESGTRAERYQVMVHCDAATLADAPKPPGWADARNGRKPVHAGRKSEEVDADLPPVPSAQPGAPQGIGHAAMSNGAALHPDSAITWSIEAAAREAMEESLETRD